MPRFALLAALLVLVAGCVTPAPGDDDGDQDPTTGPWAERALVSDEEHDHADASQHAGMTTPNFQLLGWDPMVSPTLGRTSGGMLCGEVGTNADGTRLAVVNSFFDDVAFVVADVTDPAAPAMVGEYVLERVQTYDVAMTDDAKYVIVGADPETDAPTASLLAGTTLVQPKWRDACTGEERAAGPESALPLAPSTILVDITDPTNPVFADVSPTPVLGPHSVFATTIDGHHYVVSSITNLQHQSSYFTFYEITQTPLGPKLVTLSTYQAPPGGPDSTIPLINGHVDATIAKHPIDGKVYAYLADWDAGMIILDFTNPRAPVEVSRWGGAANGPVSTGDDETGAIHETYPLPVTWDGKHYTLAGQEMGGRPEGRPTGWVFILDTTDPANPVEAGRWTLPADVDWMDQFLFFSTHYVAVVDRTMFVSMYHGGVWAVDLSTPEAIAEPRAVGVFVPDRESPSPPPGTGDLDCCDLVLDVLPFENGDLAVYASKSGVYMVRFDPTVAMTPAEPWVVT